MNYANARSPTSPPTSPEPRRSSGTTRSTSAAAARCRWPRPSPTRGASLAAIESELAALETGEVEAPQSSDELIDHILERYHATHRAELPELVRLAARVEARHAENPLVPRGIHAALVEAGEALEEHMQKEEQVLFPLMRAGGHPMIHGPIGRMRHEHDEHGERLANLEADRAQLRAAGRGLPDVARALRRRAEADRRRARAHSPGEQRAVRAVRGLKRNVGAAPRLALPRIGVRPRSSAEIGVGPDLHLRADGLRSGRSHATRRRGLARRGHGSGCPISGGGCDGRFLAAYETEVRGDRGQHEVQPDVVAVQRDQAEGACAAPGSGPSRRGWRR